MLEQSVDMIYTVLHQNPIFFLYFFIQKEKRKYPEKYSYEVKERGNIYFHSVCIMLSFSVVQYLSLTLYVVRERSLC